MSRSVRIVLAGAAVAALVAPALRAEDPRPDDVDAALEAARDPERAEAALGALRAIVRRHEEVERARAARALLGAADAAEKLGRRDDALAFWARVEQLFPERKADRDEAERRSRALRDGGGVFLEALLSRAARARGRDVLDKVRALRAEGAIVAGERRVPFTLTAARGPLRVRQDAPELGFSSGWNGERGWRRTRKDGVSVLSGPRLDDLVRWADGTWRELTGNQPGTARATGPTTVEGKAAHRVEWREASGEVLSIDLGAHDALPARATGTALGLDGEPGPVTIYFRDWREVQGAKFAGRVDYWKGAELAYSFVYERVVLDPEIAAGFFDPPPP